MDRRRIVIGLALLPLAACGRRAPPKPPVDAYYPHTYPTKPAIDRDGPGSNPNGVPQTQDDYDNPKATGTR